MDEPNELIEAWLNWLSHNRGRSDATVDKYRRHLLRLEAFLAERGISLPEASTELLEEFTGLQAHKEGLTPSSRRPLVAAVTGFYAWLRRKGRIPVDPAREIPYPNAGVKLPTPMDLHHAEQLLMQPDINTFLGIRDAAMLSVMIGCGLRVSGLVGLNENSLHFTRWNDQEWLVLKVLEKGKKERYVPAPHECRVLIRSYLGHPELEAIDRRLADGNQVLFVSMNNRSICPADYHGEARRIAPRSVHDMIRKYSKQAGIPMSQAHPHALRHLYGTQMTEADVNTLSLQALMGHARAETTQVYAHLAMRKLTEVVSKGNPLRRMKTPVTDLVRELERRGL